MSMTDQRGILLGSVASILSSNQFNNRFFEYGKPAPRISYLEIKVLISNGPRDCEE